jgi:Rrf2 family protein
MSRIITKIMRHDRYPVGRAQWRHEVMIQAARPFSRSHGDAVIALDGVLSRNYHSFMKRDGKLHLALHVLAHLAEAGDRPTTSEDLAAHLCTNAVVIRRSLAGLREAGLVTSVKGHGGGWTIARPAAAISLGAVYAALDARGELTPRRAPDPSGCLIERAVDEALDGFYAEMETLLIRRLDGISLADLAADFGRRRAEWIAAAGHTAALDS